MMRGTILAILFVFTVVAGAAATAWAQPEVGYQSPMRAQCEAELRQDAAWRAELKKQLSAEVHAEDANAMLTNKRHVVMAYAALWLLVLVFAVFLWIRQRNLKDEIARLEREIEQATAND
jgi:hypothetical protein